VKYKPHRPLWKHQKRVLKRLWKIGSALLWADTGTGKTKTIVDYVYASHQAGRIKRVLVVCPLAVVGVGVDESKANCPRRGGERQGDRSTAGERATRRCEHLFTERLG